MCFFDESLISILLFDFHHFIKNTDLGFAALRLPYWRVWLQSLPLPASSSASANWPGRHYWWLTYWWLGYICSWWNSHLLASASSSSGRFWHVENELAVEISLSVCHPACQINKFIFLEKSNMNYTSYLKCFQELKVFFLSFLLCFSAQRSCLAGGPHLFLSKYMYLHIKLLKAFIQVHFVIHI